MPQRHTGAGNYIFTQKLTIFAIVNKMTKLKEETFFDWLGVRIRVTDTVDLLTTAVPQNKAAEVLEPPPVK